MAVSKEIIVRGSLPCGRQRIDQSLNTPPACPLKAPIPENDLGFAARSFGSSGVRCVPGEMGAYCRGHED